MWGGVPGPELGLPRAYFAAPFDIETTYWNMSQGAAAGAVVSTVDDMHVFIEALLAGDLFASENSLTEMQAAVTAGSMTILNYGIGLAEKARACGATAARPSGSKATLLSSKNRAFRWSGGRQAQTIFGYRGGRCIRSSCECRRSSRSVSRIGRGIERQNDRFRMAACLYQDG